MFDNDCMILGIACALTVEVSYVNSGSLPVLLKNPNFLNKIVTNMFKDTSWHTYKLQAGYEHLVSYLTVFLVSVNVTARLRTSVLLEVYSATGS